MPTVLIRGSDLEILEIPASIANEIKALDDFIRADSEYDLKTTTFNIENVSGYTLKKCVKWLDLKETANYLKWSEVKFHEIAKTVIQGEPISTYYEAAHTLQISSLIDFCKALMRDLTWDERTAFETAVPMRLLTIRALQREEDLSQ